MLHLNEGTTGCLSFLVGLQEVQTFSISNYENEFLQHPDLVNTWAVDEAFLARFQEGFNAYKIGNWGKAQGILEETRKARRAADGRKVSIPPPSCPPNTRTMHEDPVYKLRQLFLG